MWWNIVKLFFLPYIKSKKKKKKNERESRIHFSTVHFRSLAQMSVLFGQVVRGLSAGSRVFEVNYTVSLHEAYTSVF